MGNAGGAERFKSIVPIAKVMERSIAALVAVMVCEIVAYAKVADLCVATIVEERALSIMGQNIARNVTAIAM